MSPISASLGIPVSQSLPDAMVNTAQTALWGHLKVPRFSRQLFQRPQLLRTTFHQFLSSVTKMPGNRDSGREEVGMGHLGPVRKQRHECCCPASFPLLLIQDLSPWSQVPRVTVRNTSFQVTTVIMHTLAQRLSLQ